MVRYRQPNGVEKTWHCDAVAMCSGLHVVPNIPHIEGIEKVPLALHSSRFKGRSQFGEAKNILVLGSGETGADVAYMAVTAPTKRVVLCHNDGFHLAPKVSLLDAHSKDGANVLSSAFLTPIYSRGCSASLIGYTWTYPSTSRAPVFSTRFVCRGR